MAASVLVSQIIENCRITESENGLEVVERFLVTGLDAASRSPQYDALLTSGLPAFGDPHPHIPGVLVRQRSPLPFLKSKNEVKVDVIWRTPTVTDLNPNDPPRIEFHATTTEVNSNKDLDGNIIKVDYKDRATQVGSYRQRKSTGILTFDFATRTDPTFLLSYFGRMNMMPWRLGEANTWMFYDMNIAKHKSSPWWLIHLGFDYDSDTHIQTCFWRDQQGIIPEDINQPINLTLNKAPKYPYGWTNAAPARQADFNLLGLPSAF